MKSTNLFKTGEFHLSSGIISNFKIDCDALTDKDIEALALMISEKIKFREAIPVPTGGNRLATALRRYEKDDKNLPFLIVDDVLTTGGSMERAKKELSKDLHPAPLIKGVVIFNRGVKLDWVTSLFSMETDELIRTQNQYIKLLIKVLDSSAGFLAAHKWKYSDEDIKEGKSLREKIEKLTK